MTDEERGKEDARALADLVNRIEQEGVASVIIVLAEADGMQVLTPDTMPSSRALSLLTYASSIVAQEWVEENSPQRALRVVPHVSQN